MWVGVGVGVWVWVGVGVSVGRCGCVRMRRLEMDNLHVCIVPFLLQSLFDHIPVGVGSKGMIPLNAK